MGHKMVEFKKILKREDLNCAGYLMSLQESLKNDFLSYHGDFVEGDFLKGEPAEPIHSVDSYVNKPGAWKGTVIKYIFLHKKDIIAPEIRKYFKTAINLVNEFAGDCPICSYSVIEPGGIIKRHTGPEYRNGEFIRIHIPLIVPEGDIFFEVGGEVVYWNDIFGFDNQTIHSAYNFSDQRRLVFLIDIRRSRLGLPPGRTWDKNRDEDSYPPFDPEPYRKYK